MSKRIQDLHAELERLKAQMALREAELIELHDQQVTLKDASILPSPGLTQHEVNRYSRQLILPEIGVTGQLKLKNAAVLVVGTGGLGCAAALYLAGAGVGRIGLVDGDIVELNNLHRQLLHAESAVGTAKALSGKESLRRVNSAVRVDAHNVQLSSGNAMGVLREYDVIVDATDNVPTRYLINDACVLLHRPLVSGSALRLEGQLTVYNHNNAPCYRCVFPVPTPHALVTNCGDAGVLGAVVGVIGTLQALEVIKIVVGWSAADDGGGSLAGTMLLYDAMRTQFRRIRLRERCADCAVCGDTASIRELIDYEQFCQARASDKTHDVQLLPEAHRCGVQEFRRMQECVRPVPVPWLLIDVRTPTEFEIGSIEGAVNVPFEDIVEDRLAVEMRERLLGDEQTVLFVVCRRGNDSQKAVLKLREMADGEVGKVGEKMAAAAAAAASGEGNVTQGRKKVIKDLVGGLTEWHRLVDSAFPIY